MSREEKSGFFRNVMASVCHNCPICKYGRQAPRSLVGRILHHRLHAEHCPFWKAEDKVYGKARISPDSPQEKEGPDLLR